MKKLFFSFLSLFVLTACNGSVSQVDDHQDQVACTQEAKLCPDGSYVSRTGPRCEFEACPKVEPVLDQDTSDWVGSQDSQTGIRFSYPKALDQKYTTLLTNDDYRPGIQVNQRPFECVEPTYKDGPPFTTESKMLEGKEYCLKLQVDAAAGSAYKTFSYSTADGDGLVRVVFTLQQVNCGNYDEAEKNKCEQEQLAFNPDELALAIFKTVRR